MQPLSNKHNDAILIKACVVIAGGLRALERETGVSRVTCWRLLNGSNRKLQSETRAKLEAYVTKQL